MKKIRSISTAGKVIAHVNEAFGDGEEIATLIAAAPDLLAALSELMAEFDTEQANYAAEHNGFCHQDSEGIKMARAALTKAGA